MLMCQLWQTLAGRVLTRNLRYFQSCSTLLQSVRAKQVNPDQKNRILEVKWTDGSFNRYPFVYLRDQCQCCLCRYDTSRQRLLPMKNLNVDSAPLVTRLKENGGKIEVTWQDNHVSEYDSDRLLEESVPQNNALLHKDVQLWGKDLKLPEFDFETMLKDERSLLEWLLTLRRVGAAVLKGVPRKVGQLERFGNRVGFLKSTFYGETASDIRNEEQAANALAYTNQELQPHTDLTYCESKPAMILLQYIDQPKSPSAGENTLVDGFNICEQLKKEHPQAFDLLVSTPVLWRANGRRQIYGSFRLTSTRPVIELSWTGKLARINYSEPSRVKFVNASMESITEIYHAYQAFTRMFYESRFLVKKKLSEGDILTLDNDRVLHGRSGLGPNKKEKRWLQVAYVDRDVLNSKFDLLKAKNEQT